MARFALGGMLVALVAVLATTFGGGARTAHGCAFLRTPSTYEADRARATYLQAIDAASVDALFPGDPVFGLPAIEVGTRANRAETAVHQVPASLLRSIAWVESGLTMASRSVPFESAGQGLVSFDCGHGIMQVTTGMTVPLGAGGEASAAQVSVATHYAHNVARGAAILADKWNRAPELRPIVGTDTNSNPALIENWYVAVWSYNGFTGPGDLRSNHPADPQFSPVRERYRCDGTQSRNRYPYQELVWGCLATPPAGSNGAPLWTAVPATLPDLSQPQFFTPLSIANFQLPYVAMDMPTPQPAHNEVVPAVDSGVRTRLLGSPSMSVAGGNVVLRTDGPPSQSRATIEVRNTGTGLLSWSAVPSASWIVVDPPAGVALGSDVACATPGCERNGTITVSVNPTLLPAASASGSIRITSPNGGGPPVEVRVEVQAEFEVGAPGTSRAN